MTAMTRSRRHLALAAGSAAISVIAMALAPAGQALDRLSFVTPFTEIHLTLRQNTAEKAASAVIECLN